MPYYTRDPKRPIILTTAHVLESFYRLKGLEERRVDNEMQKKVEHNMEAGDM